MGYQRNEPTRETACVSKRTAGLFRWPFRPMISRHFLISSQSPLQSRSSGISGRDGPACKGSSSMGTHEAPGHGSVDTPPLWYQVYVEFLVLSLRLLPHFPAT